MTFLLQLGCCALQPYKLPFTAFGRLVVVSTALWVSLARRSSLLYEKITGSSCCCADSSVRQGNHATFVKTTAAGSGVGKGEKVNF